MAKDPAFLFYPGDYISGTMHLDFECKGAYMDLLMLQFQKDHMTIHMIKHVLGHKFDHIWSQISDKFKEKDGKFWNERLRVEKEKRSSFCKSRKKNREGVKDMTTHMCKHMEDEDINSINVVNSEKKEVEIVGSELAINTARKAWDDQRWREQLCMAHSMSESDLKKWMAQFNASVSNDPIPDFGENKYKKLFGGWLNTQKGKGYKLTEKAANGSPTLRKISS